MVKRLDFSLPFKCLVLSSYGSLSQWPFSKLLERVKISKINVKTCLKVGVALNSGIEVGGKRALHL